jgi:uncharacterized protein YecT (DUF1311 family)
MSRTTPLVCIAALVCVTSSYARIDSAVMGRLSPAVKARERAPDSGGTAEQAACYFDEDRRQDRLLNELRKRMLARSSPAERSVLRRTERRWIKRRDTLCGNERSKYINSTAAYMFNVCMSAQTIRRIISLEQLG